MKIISVKDYSALSRAAANIIAAQVILKPRCVLGLPACFLHHRWPSADAAQQ